MPSSLLKTLALSTMAVGITTAETLSNSARTATSAKDTVHTVQVGQGGLTFTPNSLTAAVGDKIAFVYASSGHTATQGDFNNPCQPLDATSWNSGFVNPGGDDFVITVNSTEPMYFYCAALGHCQAGMAGAVNAPSSKSASDYIDAGKKTSGSKAQANVQGGVFEKLASTSGTPSQSTTSATSTPTGGASQLQQASTLAMIAAILGFAL